ncbi:cytochrome P450 [Musa troglodytarum]|uniref:Cytochrome P450 n=1 Tax=Musa troglodytarum TaxID=320322 RepID=A0A9E7I2J8_9LILI|nr:cytochrome P450 [Musa troglodytarum]
MADDASSFTFLSSLLIPLLVLLLASLSRRWLKSARKNAPPSPPSFPIIGHLHLIAKPPLHRALAAIAAARGHVVLLRLGSRPVLLVSSAPAAEECFTVHDLAFANRPRLLAAQILGYGCTTIAWSPYGPHWRNLRRISAVHLLSTGALRSSSDSRTGAVRSLAKALFLEGGDSGAGRPTAGGDEVELLQSGVRRDDGGGGNGHRWGVRGREAAIPGGSGGDVCGTIGCWNRHVGRHHGMGHVPPAHPPRSLARGEAELDAKIGQGRMAEEEDIPNLPYLNCIINETLRLYPAGPLLVPHESSQDCTVGGYDVPRGTMLLVNAWAIHRDPNSWDEPEEFKPERFQCEGGQEEAGLRMLPFGSGRRKCPGEGLAMRVIGLALATLIHCFEWEKLPGEEVDMTEGRGLTMPKARPLEAMCTPRHTMLHALSQL